MPGGPTKTTQGWASCIPSLTTFSGETTAVNGDLAPWDFSLTAWRALRRQRIHKTALQTFFATVDGQNLAPPYAGNSSMQIPPPPPPWSMLMFVGRPPWTKTTNVNIESKGVGGNINWCKISGINCTHFTVQHWNLRPGKHMRKRILKLVVNKRRTCKTCWNSS